jgi:hypothetical protein
VIRDLPPDNPKPEDLAIREKFIARLVELGVRSPILMQNDDGEVGFYWDDDRFYFDGEVDEDGTVSIYGKDREALKVPNQEKWVDKLTIEMVTAEWVNDFMPELKKSC